MNNKKIRIAIVGLGFGAEFIPIYQKHPNAEMVAICQRNGPKLNEIGDAFGIKKRYTKYQDLLRDSEIDAVHINTPIPNHGEQSIDRSLLCLLKKIDGELDRLELCHGLQMPEYYGERRETIKKIYAQQHMMFHTGGGEAQGPRLEHP